MQLALYRMERPMAFEQIIGQDHIVRILENQIKTGHVSQAYLFTGTRGTGKTTTARILAKAVNCTGPNPPCCECENCRSIKNGTFMDVIELDAASNNGVDDLRAVIDSVQYPPAIGKYKVYIIDEVHMLTPAAENAFLKTLEEPPEYAIFILATTDPEKVKSTIKSRCMTLNFRRVSEEELIKGMERICTKYGVNPTKDALSIISRKADGSVRDALGILEQCIETGEKNIDEDLVYEYTGSIGDDFYIKLVNLIINAEAGEAFTEIDSMINRGKDAKQMLSDFLMHIRNLLIVKCTDNANVIIGSSKENIERLSKQAESIELTDIKNWIRYLSMKLNQIRYSAIPRIILEIAVIEMIAGIDDRESENGAIRLLNKTRTGMKSLPAMNKSNSDAIVKFLKKADLSKKEIDADKKTSAINKDYNSDEVKKTDKVNDLKKSKGTSTSFSSDDVDYDEMWNEVLDEVARGDMGFTVMVGNNSTITSYQNGEITLTVKPTKLSLAKTSQKMLDDAAKKLFGEDTFFTIKPGDIDKQPKSSKNERKKTIKEEPIISDIDGNEANSFDDIWKKDISDVFGIDKSKIKIVE